MPPTPFESATLNLKLFELRRDPVLRESRHWFLAEFTPATLDELIAIAGSERNASYRMVLGYWDMAASLVTTGAIDAAAFRAANPEMFATFAKVYPFLDELRRISGIPEFLQHLEQVITSFDDGAQRVAMLRAQFLAAKEPS